MKRYDYLCESVAVVTTALQTQQIFQIISLILTIIATSISIALSIYNWYKKSKSDGKITIDEVNELNKSFLEWKEEIEQNFNNKGDNKNG